MGQVIANFTMSLDGFIAGPNDEMDRLFAWYRSGDTDFRMADGVMVVRISQASAALLRNVLSTSGALVTGRRTFDFTHGWGGRHPMNIPVFVVTHTVPTDWVKPGAPFTFVTDGVASAVAQARAVAGGKNVAVGAPQIAQQCLRAGLLDELHLDLASVVLGSGLRLFDSVGTDPIDLECLGVVQGIGVTHLRYRIVR